LLEDVYTNTLLSWRAVIWRKFIAVVEREGKVITEWQVRSYFIFSLFPFNTSFLLTTPHLLCLVKAGDGQREKEETLMLSLICRREPIGHIFSADVDA